MKRRNFIRNTTIATASLFSFPAFAKPKLPELVTIRGGSILGMLELGMDTLGGIKRFVKPGQKVLLLPSLGHATVAKQADNTNPRLIKQLSKLCYDAGASQVSLLGQPKDRWRKVLKHSGYKQMAKEASISTFRGTKKSAYQELTNSNGNSYSEIKLHQAAVEADCIINVPILKMIDRESFSASITNLGNLIYEFDRIPTIKQEDKLLKILQAKMPFLTIIDAYRVQTPASSSQKTTNYRTLILSNDCIAADSAAAKRMGLEVSSIEILQKAQQKGLGQVVLSTDQQQEIILKRQRAN